MWGAIAFGDVGSAIAKRSVGIAFWGCGKCDSEALRRNRFWVCGDVGVRSLLGDIGGAIAKRSVGIAVWDVGNAIAVLGEWGVRSLFGYVGSAIAGWECLDAIAFGMCGMRSLFWDVGCDRFWGCWECDSEALRRNRCLGFWECDSCVGMCEEL
jgi:hypothetical protein